MAVLGSILLGLAAAMLAGALVRGETGGLKLLGRVAAGIGGAIAGALVAVAAGIGPMDDFFDAGVWAIALGGAVVALLVYELVREPAQRGGLWTGTAGGESERLDRNW